jgi:hypothetical protein
MIGHIVLTVQSYEKSKAFYLKALKPLGYGLVAEYPGHYPDRAVLPPPCRRRTFRS